MPDKRFDALVGIHKPKKRDSGSDRICRFGRTFQGAGKGEGLGNAFLSFVADADALIQVIRCFDNLAVEHPEGSIDPIRGLGYH